MSERSGVEIDYCPQCRGVWLDRGELDKIIEKSEGAGASAGAHARPVQPQYQEPRHDSHHDSHHTKRPHKRESFLGDLFDF
jgi:Zn-finger nucleic acid-binding protein